jgi:anthranilate synthase/aminodeoxychorismate synthase-like glutamine amidotransferase
LRKNPPSVSRRPEKAGRLKTMAMASNEPMRLLLLDNYDSFTYNLYDYLLQTGVQCTVLRNDAFGVPDFPDLRFDAAVLSPGPRTPTDAGILMAFIHYFHAHKPMLGVCLGQQALGQYFGAPLLRAQAPMHGKTSLIRHQGHPLFEGIGSPTEVMRYHSLILGSLDNTPFDCIASTEQGEIMAISHRFLPLWGVQFHPESILSPAGFRMIQNWVHHAHHARHSELHRR